MNKTQTICPKEFLGYYLIMTEFNKISNNAQLKRFAGLADEIWHECFGFLLSNEQIDYMVARFQSYEAVKAQIADGYEYYFIEQNGEIAGYTGFCPKEDKLFLSKLYILKNFRNCGLGRKTFEFLIEKAHKYKLFKIMLTVNKHNAPAITAYEKWGFKNVDSIVTDIGCGFVMDDYVMEYAL